MKGRGAILQKTNQDMHSWCLEIYSPGIEIYPEIYPYSLFPWIRRGNWYHSHVCMLQLWSCILFVWSVKQTKKKVLIVMLRIYGRWWALESSRMLSLFIFTVQTWELYWFFSLNPSTTKKVLVPYLEKAERRRKLEEFLDDTVVSFKSGFE